MNTIIKNIEDAQLKAEVPAFNVGDTVRVSAKIKEGNRERIQVFEGTVFRGYCQKQQRDDGIANRAQQTRKKVIQKYSRDSSKNDDQIIVHQADDLFRHLQRAHDPAHPPKGQHIQKDAQCRDQSKGGNHAFFQPIHILLAKADRKDRAASHAQPE